MGPLRGSFAARWQRHHRDGRRVRKVPRSLKRKAHGKRDADFAAAKLNQPRPGGAAAGRCRRKENMGQAKDRGTAEQRAQRAREKRREGLQPVDIDELRAAHDVPADAEFVGFVVWLRERDEFLVRLDERPGATARSYGRLVDAAVLFRTWDDAAPHAEASKHLAIVAAAFDMGKRMMVIGG